MNLSSVSQNLLLALFGTLSITLGVASSTTAAQFSDTPLFKEVNSYETKINGDFADVYFPVTEPQKNTETFPIALFLQGALVDKSNYSKFASIVTSYGFIVVVPNHFNQNFVPPGFPQGFYSEEEEVNQVIDYIKSEKSNYNSPIHEIIDIDKLVLLGHSYGGIVGLNAIEGNCIYPYCIGEFTRPQELVGGAFYGSDFNQLGIFEQTPPINNDGIPIALLAGTLDGLASFNGIKTTYEQLQTPPKYLLGIIGANHYSITNTNNPFPIPDSTIPSIDQNVGIETIARWSSLFLKATVLNDQNALNYVYNLEYPLDINVNVISQLRYVPEPNSILSLLCFSTFGTTLWLWRKINCVTKGNKFSRPKSLAIILRNRLKFKFFFF
ncbi:MAG: chlorophyllase [Nostoc sp.]|uniref:alpha/beta hydrolase family protein n=1 Tax=Nostoc sp. TaxID=1180 RepID=UPI002FF5EBF4